MSESKPTINPYTYTTLAGERNRDPILQISKTFFPKAGDALELASGSGAHINYFAQHFPGIRFQPSDCDVNVFEIIRSNRARAGNTNVAEPQGSISRRPAPGPKGSGFTMSSLPSMCSILPPSLPRMDSRRLQLGL